MKTGTLVVGFSLLSPAPDCAQATQGAGNTKAPGGPKGQARIDSWIRINADETVTVFTGKTEPGARDQDRAGADRGGRAGRRDRARADGPGRYGLDARRATPPGASRSKRAAGRSRGAAAEARQVLIGLAAERLGEPAGRLEARDGRVSVRGGAAGVPYGELLGGKRIERNASGAAPVKRPEQYRLVGKSVPRLDLPDIVTGGPVYVHDLRPPGMLHGRIVRPPSYGARLRSIPETEVRALPGVVKVVRDGSFVAVAAEREEQAIRAAERLRQGALWSEGEDLPDFRDWNRRLRESPTQDRVVRDEGDAEAALRDADVRLAATYTRPYLMHASLGPSCALAELRDGSLAVWTHSQGVFPLRRSLADLLAMPPEKIRVISVPGAGCYGHNGADDVAADAALLARAVPDRPVRVQWMREDEHGWEPYGSAMMIDIRGGLDAAGNVVAWDYAVWTDAHSTRPGGDAGALLAARHLAEPRELPSAGNSAGGYRNAEPLYALPNQRIVARSFRGPLRVSALRSLGAYANVFALESFLDELAQAAGADPLAFRLRHLKDGRGRAVLEAAASAIGWGAGELPRGRGRGIGFARYKNHAAYCAVCAEVEVGTPAGQVRVVRAVAAVDAGQVVNPDGLRNQIEGGVIQSASWTLKEQVAFDRRRVTSRDWDTYPILRFPEAPVVDVVLRDRPDEPPLGAGEAAQGPAAAAIANAVFHATGKRVRDLPITPDKLL